MFAWNYDSVDSLLVVLYLLLKPLKVLLYHLVCFVGDLAFGFHYTVLNIVSEEELNDQELFRLVPEEFVELLLQTLLAPDVVVFSKLIHQGLLVFCDFGNMEGFLASCNLFRIDKRDKIRGLVTLFACCFGKSLTLIKLYVLVVFVGFR